MNNIFGKHDKVTLDQFKDVESRAVKAALMADGHKGYIQPIGGVTAYDNMVSIMGVGVDIACGNCGLKLDTKLSDLGKSDEKRAFMLNRIADKIEKNISFGMGRSNKSDDVPDDHDLFTSPAWTTLKNRAGHGLMRSLYDKAKLQIGTVGGGNHYVDVFVDEEDNLWVGVHFGSRGLGHGIAQGFNTLAQGGVWGDKSPEAEGLVSLKSSLGQDYWELMHLAGEYAYAGREWVARKVAELMSNSKVIDMVHNNHNFAWKEEHYVSEEVGKQELVVVRKGATPAFPGQRGFVGGSMGDNSVVLEGADTATMTLANMRGEPTLQETALYSTVHGAGRVMSRGEAKGSTNFKTGEPKLDENGLPKRAGKITVEMMNEWVKNAGVIRRGGEVDEAPQAYRRLPDVLAYQGDTIKVVHTLKPLIAVMAGKGVYDPYKD